MTAEVHRMSRPTTGGPQAKRRLRNYLLEPRFQLKYTAMVVGVTVAVGGVLGYFAYDYSKGQTEMLTINKMEAQLEKGNDISDQFVLDLNRYAEEADRRVAAFIVLGILALALALGLTGIVVTHKLVGPAFRLKYLLGEVQRGHWKVEHRLRKGDELQDVFEAFQAMIQSLRAAQEEEIRLLDDALERAKQAGVPEESIAAIREVRDRMQAALD